MKSLSFMLGGEKNSAEQLAQRLAARSKKQ
jgi:hypothetical protein